MVIRRALLAAVVVFAVAADPSSAQAPVISFSPSPVNFGSVPVGAQSLATVTATNNSVTPKEITSVVVSGNGFDRALGGSCGAAPFVLPANGSCGVTLRFMPPGRGVFDDGWLQFNYGASANSVELSGTGTEPHLLFEPASLGFADRTIGTTSDPGAIAIRNDGDAPLQVTGVSIAGLNPDDFAIVGGSCPSAALFSLAVDQSCTKSIAFTPTASGPRSASLTVSDNAPGSPHSAALSGGGLRPPAPEPEPTPEPEPEPTPAPAKADATIKRLGDRAAVGDDVYIDAVQQTRKWSARTRQKRAFIVGLENDGRGAGPVTVAGCGKVAKFKVKYFAGEQNVTAAVKAGTYSTGPLAPGASSELTLEMTPKRSAEPRSRGVCVTTAADAGATDAVAASVKVKPAL